MDSCYNFDIGKIKTISKKFALFAGNSHKSVKSRVCTFFILSTKKIEFILQPLFIKSNYHGKERCTGVTTPMYKGRTPLKTG